MNNTFVIILLLAILTILIPIPDESTKSDKIVDDRSTKMVTYTINSFTLDCLQTNSMISCNWDKYNEDIRICKEKSLERRTMDDGIVFPPIKGECGDVI